MTDGGLVRWMFHATAVVASYDATYGPLRRWFGCRALHDEVDERPGIMRRGGMTWIGDGSIELAEPLAADSPGGRFLARFGSGMQSFGVQVDDVDEVGLRSHLEAVGVRIAIEPTAGIVFTDPATTAGVLVEWSSLDTGDDPHFGAPLPSFVVEPLVAVPQLAYLTALAADPVEAAKRLGEVLGVDAVVVDAAATDRPAAVVPLGDCVLGLVRLPADETESVVSWGAPFARPRLHALALRVDDLDGAVTALAADGVGAHRQWDRATLLDPRATPLPIVLDEQLLPGDPRSR